MAAIKAAIAAAPFPCPPDASCGEATWKGEEYALVAAGAFFLGMVSRKPPLEPGEGAGEDKALGVAREAQATSVEVGVELAGVEAAVVAGLTAYALLLA